MQADEEDAWRAIVANYGERVLEPETSEEDESPEERSAASLEEPESEPERPEPAPRREQQLPRELTESDVDRFVPPRPPPQPLPPPGRLAAWVGVIGGPALLVISVLAPFFSLPTWFAYLLVGGFMGGFGYLVATMNDDPPDPGDNGARV